MDLPRTRASLPRVEWLDSVGSTNAALRDLLLREEGGLAHGALVATAEQTSGRGRRDRGWTMPPDTALAISVLIRDAGTGGLPVSWLPLLAGSAVTAALQPLFPPGRRVGLKWPNDVHVRDEEDALHGRPGLKLCGILCEAVPAGGDETAVVVGMGVNLLIPEWQLPSERATSVLAAGGDVGGAESLADPAGRGLADRVLSGVAGELLRIVELSRSDPDAARRTVTRHSLTLGTEVRVHLPDARVVDGRARALDDDGALIVDLPTGGALTVTAADVEHLR
ncbi:biotin--[acetyl-CoA-carboxylase] ligase [Leucobacter weissii]|uniref:biotin--[biotin carboxyl-carrier protein] ligase n=1 Tax=Leucobacter weissii TaxID=1983706 RepID=A0A939MNI0_9MICO|nr:biotin--[acetyl-CoA-carboxylase] ligase [Leucobacter weissii]MBO1901701.1 biotin--[acetyl-CoA-carboxylase] ligase [Leucobacter weissii]